MRRSIILVTFLLLASSAITLSGCATKLVYVPYAITPQVSIPNQPQYQLQTIQQTDGYDIVVKKWAASFQQCQDYSKSLRVLLEGYNSLESGVIFNGLLPER